MALILSIESATKNCSVAVARDGDVLAIRELCEERFSHAEKLHSFVLEVMSESGHELSELDAVAVSKGPGSYTGLRIGVSTAKGLCYAVDKPLISVPTLESLARQVDASGDELIIPLLDARRMEVYSAVFDSGYSQIRETRAEVIESGSYEAYLYKSKVFFLGDGAKKTKAAIDHPNAVFLPSRYPSSREAAVLAETRYREKDFEDLAYFEPFYLKDFIAGKPKKYF
jgi:tRNA threonylcarbamoyladenosine biosynthesis protein TsaB